MASIIARASRRIETNSHSEPAEHPNPAAPRNAFAEIALSLKVESGWQPLNGYGMRTKPELTTTREIPWLERCRSFFSGLQIFLAE